MECNVQLAMGHFGKKFTGQLEFYPLFYDKNPLQRRAFGLRFEYFMFKILAIK